MRLRLIRLAGSFVLVAACGSAADEAATTEPPTPSTTSVPSTDAVAPSVAPTPGSTLATVDPGGAVPEILDVVAPVVGGGELDLAALAGRPLALWFWAPT
jgi:hypothetical protein